MNYFLTCFLVFIAAYGLSAFYITVFYHRGLTHNAVKLRPWARSLIIHTGNWVTGIDPKGWACLHRLHHLHSDTAHDPHSPWNKGLFGMAEDQLKSFSLAVSGLIKGRTKYTSLVSDLDFDVHWLNRHRLWWLPHVAHGLIALSIGVFFHAWLMGLAFWLGIMSHPVQGWMVNSFGHKFGYRNFDTADQSRNNTLVAWLVVGEGYQNNHHAHPSSAKFSKRWFEFDAGYVMCLFARRIGLIELN